MVNKASLSKLAKNLKTTGAWLDAHKPAVAIVAVVLIAGAATGALLLSQDISLSPSAATPDVIFASGNDYAAINALGLANLTVGSSATSASLDISGIPGAADLQLTDLLKITNQDTLQAYNVTIVRSAAPNVAITALEVHVFDAGDSLVATWDASAASQSGTFSLPASTTYDIRVDIVIADGTAVGSLGALDLQVRLVPA